MAYAPTVTALTDETPMPRTEVIFSSLHPDAESLAAIWRLGDNREYRVRGSLNIPVAGSVSRLDFEAPFGIPVTYRAEMLDGDGISLGFTDPSSPVTLVCEDTWVHNPLDPTKALKVTLLSTAAGKLARPVQGEIVYPIARRVGVVISSVRQGLRAVNLDLFVESFEAADKFAALVGDYVTSTVPVLCFRVPGSAKMRLPRPLFASVMNPVEVPLDNKFGRESVMFEVTGDEAEPPTPALIVPLLTRADISAFYATRAALNADNLTRLAVNRRYDLAGTAP